MALIKATDLLADIDSGRIVLPRTLNTPERRAQERKEDEMYAELEKHPILPPRLRRKTANPHGEGLL